MMSTRVYVGNLPLSAIEDQLREQVAPHVEATSVRMAIPVWRFGTLPGVMAGKRPAASRPVQLWSTFPGGMGA
jgi:hypothetical protein